MTPSAAVEVRRSGCDRASEYDRPDRTPPRREYSRGHSGRRFVLVAGLAGLLIWGTLFWFFATGGRDIANEALWSDKVVPAIDRLSRSCRPMSITALWRDAIDQTRAMLTTVTGSNLLDVKDIDPLRAELSQRVARACDHPETAVGELAEIWNQVADRGEFLLRDSRSVSGDRHPRPKILPPRRGKPPVDSAVLDR